MFWWFKRGAHYVRYEARQVGSRVYELCFVDVDGIEKVERFDDQQALVDRQRELESTLADDGWTGPHGWNL